MLKLQFKDQRKPAIWLVSPTLKIGQDKSCDIVIQDEGVAEVQVELLSEDQSVKIKPLDIANRTLVNGTRLISDRSLKPSDIITIGKTELQIIDPLQEINTNPPKDQAESTEFREQAVRWMLRATSAPFKGQLFPIQDLTSVGRDSSSDIPIPLNHVSRKHAELIMSNDTLVIKDLKSRNGTFVNGKKIDKHILKHGDNIRIDMIAFKVIGPHCDNLAEPKRDPDATQIRPVKLDSTHQKTPKISEAEEKKTTRNATSREELATRKAYLHGISGPAEGYLLELEKKQNLVGRMVGCHIGQDEESVSGRHAQINQEGGSWRLRNFGAINGTYVNGKMTSDATLIDGDKIKVGGSELVFQCVGSEPRPPKEVTHDKSSHISVWYWPVFLAAIFAIITLVSFLV